MSRLSEDSSPPREALISLPIIDNPFERVALDFVESLSKSAGGHTYILVIIDYAICYPEAMVLWSITAKVLARELLVVFSRVGFPSTILTDQDTNFLSQTLKEMW